MSRTPEDSTMTLWEHLEELRSRLVKAAFAYALGAAIAWFYREPLLLWIAQPFTEAWAAGHLVGKASLHFGAPAALFMAYLKLALLGGFVLALPLILYQVWAFIAPGLYAKEKRLTIPFVVASCSLFCLGGLFGFKFAFPIAFQYLLSFAGPVGNGDFQVTPTVMIDDYMSFVLQMLVAFGLVFELPVLVFFLSVAGIVDHKLLIRFFRHFVVVAFVVAAVFTPPDLMSQLLLAVPLVVLYSVSIVIAYFFARKRESTDTSVDAKDGDDRSL